MDEAFDIESLVHLEQTFYETGFEEGFAHGRVHGLIEGRALGRAKGFEMWEELAFYEGFGLMWMSIFEKQARGSDDRATNHARRLLEMIAQFPRVNPSAADETDIPKLFRQIRSRYKALCSTLGVRPTLRYSDRSQDRDETADATVADSDGQPTAKNIWKVEEAAPRAVTGHAFDF
ncbi:putative essential protein Yae1, N terminal [Lyophyllum shimeji]|uniref:Essential protein Yae1, N terminal n=1 Tax=Lyophyllum shimeji TaxID=47721 RepID=A0A9P3PVD5_LYOSH|nr:putative essential protein Yae1, N terminal [Lyophyllum shimeji]